MYFQLIEILNDSNENKSDSEKIIPSKSYIYQLMNDLEGTKFTLPKVVKDKDDFYSSDKIY